jgi:uncharacterized protein (DUF1330 family)
MVKEVLDEGLYLEYVGRYLTRVGRAMPLAGDWNPERIVIR